ncbi:MAG: DUF4340 domain-containing protein [Candidatus Methylumidiphilus sp.]
MKPKVLLNLVLLIVLAALAGVAFFEPGKEESKSVYLTDVDIDSLSRFELKNQESLVFEKRGGHWWLAAPFQAPANDIRIRQLLMIAKAESRAHYPVKPEEFAKFELDKPKAELNLGQVTLRFGGSEPIDMLRYVQIGETLHLVSDDFSHQLLTGATDYVDKKLLPEDAKIKELSMPGLSAKLGDKGQWSLEPPGDASALSELTNAWQSARAIEVKRHEEQSMGDKIHLGLANGQAVEFVILQREPDLLLVRPDWKLEYMVAAESGKRLLSLQKTSAETGGGPEEEESESPPEGRAEEVMENNPSENADADGD